MAKVNITKKEYQKQIDKKKKKKTVKLEKSKQIKVQQKKQNTNENIKKEENTTSVKVQSKRKKTRTSLQPLEVQPVREKKKKKKKTTEIKVESAKAFKVKKEPQKITVEKAKAIKVPAKKKVKKQKGARKIKVPKKVKLISARVLLGKVSESSFEIIKEKNEDTVVHALKDLKKYIQSGEREVVEVEKTSILSKILGVFIILGGAVAIGVLLYKPIDMKAADKEVKYRYGEWEAEQVRFCLVSPDGKYFENDHVKYEFDASRDTCIKLTRDRTVE